MRVDLHMHTDWISSALPIIWIFCVRAVRATTVTRKPVRARFGKSAVR